jgi:hypothetical protein
MITLQPAPVITVTLQAGQGPAGAPGAPGGAGAEYIAGAALSGHRVLVLNSLGQAEYASADSLADAVRLAGVSLTAASSGASITVQSAGLVEHSGWTFTPGALVYLGLAGALVESLPPGAVFSQVIGRALSATRLLVQLQPPIVIT